MQTANKSCALFLWSSHFSEQKITCTRNPQQRKAARKGVWTVRFGIIAPNLEISQFWKDGMLKMVSSWVAWLSLMLKRQNHTLSWPVPLGIHINKSELTP